MLFDEVTAALDPETRKEVLITIRQLVEDGMTSGPPSPPGHARRRCTRCGRDG